MRQFKQEFDGLNQALLGRPRAHAGGQPASILDHGLNMPGGLAHPFRREVPKGQLGRDQGVPENHVRMRRDLGFQQVRRRVAPHQLRIPTADLNLAQLRMGKRPPRDETAPAQGLILPLQQLQVVLDLVLPKPIHEAVTPAIRLLHIDAGHALRAPQLARPGIHAEVIVQPVVEDALDGLFGMVFEVVEDRHRRVAGQPGDGLADLLHRPQVGGRNRVIGAGAIRAQIHAAVGVKGDRARDVRVVDDELDHRPHLGFARWIGARAGLLAFDRPFDREVAIQVQSLERASELDRDPVVVLDLALGQNPIERPAVPARRVARDQQPCIVGMGLPRAVWVAHPHRQDAPVAIDIGQMQAVLALLERVGPGRRPNAAVALIQKELGPVRICPRHDIQRAGVQQPGELRVAAIPAQGLVEGIQRAG